MAAAAAPAPSTMNPATTSSLIEEKRVGETGHEAQSPDDAESRWRPALHLPCELTVDLALHGVTARDFLSLRPGVVMSTRWRSTRDVPLRVNGILIGWGELEAGANCLAARLTELA
jgi:flagellar motor switch/type III secretory pathway protein FliN